MKKVNKFNKHSADDPNNTNLEKDVEELFNLWKSIKERTEVTKEIINGRKRISRINHHDERSSVRNSQRGE